MTSASDTAVPAPLVAIVSLTVFAVVAHLTVPNVGDEGTLPDSLPAFGLPDVPFTLATLQLIAPYAVGIALVGLMESLMTAKLVDDITDTHSDKTRESWGQGVANIVTGFFGGMGGCAMIGQTMINVKASGARTRLSTFLAGVFLLVLVVALGDVVALIPMAALVAVMIIVSMATFDWHSVAPATLKRMPWGETIVMVTTVVGTLVSHNLAIGVVLGVLTAMIIFARRVAHLAEVTSVIDPDETTRFYAVHGELFFALQQRPGLPVRLCERPRQCRHRPLPGAHLGRLVRRGPRCDHHQVRRPRQDGRHRRPERGQRRHARQPRRQAPGRPLMIALLSPGRLVR